MSVRLLTEQHLEFLSLKEGCIGSSESIHVKIPRCWKSHVTVHFKEWQITTLSFEEDPEPFGKERDVVIRALAQESGVDVLVRTSHTLYDPQK